MSTDMSRTRRRTTVPPAVLLPDALNALHGQPNRVIAAQRADQLAKWLEDWASLIRAFRNGRVQALLLSGMTQLEVATKTQINISTVKAIAAAAWTSDADHPDADADSPVGPFIGGPAPCGP